MDCGVNVTHSCIITSDDCVIGMWPHSHEAAVPLGLLLVGSGSPATGTRSLGSDHLVENVSYILSRGIREASIKKHISNVLWGLTTFQTPYSASQCLALTRRFKGNLTWNSHSICCGVLLESSLWAGSQGRVKTFAVTDFGIYQRFVGSIFLMWQSVKQFCETIILS